MKAFLASSADRVLHLLSNQAKIDPRKTRVAFIANAADLYEGEKPWIIADHKKFEQLGYPVLDVDLRKFDKKSLAETLSNCDIVHVGGGNLLYLLALLQERELFDVIKNAVVKQGKIYTGTSAGSMIAAPSVELEKYSSESSPEIIKKLKDFKGFNFVNFLVIPHSNNDAFVPDCTEYVKHMHEQTVPLTFFYDGQAVWVEDGTLVFLGI